jgi:hypothetical protein
LAAVAGLTAAGVGFGLVMLGPDLVRDLGRLEPWQVVLVLVGDAVALFWFVVYVTRHGILGEPVAASEEPGPGEADASPGAPLAPASTEPAAGPDWGFAAALVSMLAAFVVDLAVTIYLQVEEHRRFAAAEVVDGECHTLRPKQRRSTVDYSLGCRFTDRAGQRHEASFYVGGINPNWPDDRVSPELFRDLLRERAPFAVKISYDAERPARVWLTGLGGTYHGWSIHILSRLFIVLQIMGLVAFLAAVSRHWHWHDRNPWWWDLHKALPLVVQATGLFLMGIAEVIRRG